MAEKVRGALYLAQMSMIKDPKGSAIILTVARNPGCTAEFIRESGGDLRVLRRILKEGLIFKDGGLYYPITAAL